jgi:hypothetical protein
MKPVVVTLTVVLVLGALSSRAQQEPLSRALVLDSLARLTEMQYAADSIKLNVWSDSLESRIGMVYHVDSLDLVSKIDSLRNLDLPPLPYLQKFDSLMAKKDALVQEVENKKQELLTQTRGKLDTWRNSVAEKLGLENITSPNIPAPDLPGSELTDKVSDLHQVDIPALPRADLPEMTFANQDIPEMPELAVHKLQNLDLSPDLASISESVKLPEMDKLENIKSYLGKGEKVLSSATTPTTDADGVINSMGDRISEVSDVKDQLELAEGIQDNEFMEAAEKMKDPEALKEEVKQQAVKKAVNHFAGKEEVLQSAMEKMSKYKMKYESLNSLSELKKRPPNAMRDKPFIERIVPGVAFQILRKGDLFLDVYPYIGYRISGRLTSGIGWNQRIGYSTPCDHFISKFVVYGPRWFGEAKVWKGFSGRVEVECLDTVVPPAFTTPRPDQGYREWVWTAMAGIKKEYRFLKGVKGTAFILFNLYDPKHKSPYGDVMSSRFGFEFPLKKKSKATESSS